MRCHDQAEYPLSASPLLISRHSGRSKLLMAAGGDWREVKSGVGYSWTFRAPGVWGWGAGCSAKLQGATFLSSSSHGPRRQRAVSRAPSESGPEGPLSSGPASPTTHPGLERKEQSSAGVHPLGLLKQSTARNSFAGGAVGRTLSSHWLGCKFSPWVGN